MKNRNYFFDPNGRIGILLSADYGSGWSTKAKDIRLAYDKELVEGFLNGMTTSEIIDLANRKYNVGMSYGSYFKLQVKFLPTHRTFRINHHSGKEFIEYFNPEQWIIIE